MTDSGTTNMSFTSQEMLELLCQSSRDGLLIHHEGIIQATSPSLCHLLGYDQHELTGKHIQRFISPESWPSVERYIRENTQTHYFLKVIHKNGREIDIEVFASPIQNKDLTLRSAVVRSIENTSKDQFDFLENRELFYLFMENLPACGFIKDQESRMIWSNSFMEHVLGSDRWIGMSPEEYLEPGYAAEVLRVDRAALEKGQFEVVEDFPDMNQAIRTFRTFKFRIPRIGKPPLIGGISLDITEKKKMGEELIRQQKLESIGIMAGGIAHDFNNILLMISGYLSLLELSSDISEQNRRYVANAAKGVFRAKSLSNQLLTFSKGGAPIFETASISELVKDSADFMLRGSIVVCSYDLPETLWNANVDKVQISQVIQNLVINALQAMPQGGSLSIEGVNIQNSEDDPILKRFLQKSEPEEPDQTRFLRIAIRDTGMGIPADKLKKIFDPFFTTKAKGNGLGLSIVYSIIHNHKGYLHVESEVGKGTTFRIYLPSTDRKPESDIAESSRPILGEGTILLMDDDEDLRIVTGDILRKLGYKVETAPEGNTALRIYREYLQNASPIDAVILNLTIRGGMGGKETMEHLMAMDPEVRGIIASGYSNDPVMADYRTYGFKAALSKPFETIKLSRVLYRIITTGK